MRDKILLIILGQVAVTLAAFALMMAGGMAWPRLDAAVHAIIPVLGYGLFLLELGAAGALLTNRLSLRRAGQVYEVSTVLLLGAILMLAGRQDA